MTKDEKRKTLMQELQKKYWESIIKRWSDIWDIECISTGSYTIDISLWWWMPKWRIVEVFWENSCFKTTMSMLAIKAAQQRWEKCAFIDAECSVSLEHIEALWVDLQTLIYIQPDCAENALRMVNDIAKSWEVSLIVVDSVACLVPLREVEQEVWTSHVWLHAKLINQELRIVTPLLAKTWTVLLLINQIRATMDMFSPVNTTGGKWLAYACSQRIQMLKPKIEWWDIKMRYKIHKNKMRWKVWEWDVKVNFNWWYDVAYDIGTAWAMLGVIEKNGAFYKYNWKSYQWRDSIADMPEEDMTQLKKEIGKLLK